jgi:hypothetical protein
MTYLVIIGGAIDFQSESSVEADDYMKIYGGSVYIKKDDSMEYLSFKEMVNEAKKRIKQRGY